MCWFGEWFGRLGLNEWWGVLGALPNHFLALPLVGFRGKREKLDPWRPAKRLLWLPAEGCCELDSGSGHGHVEGQVLVHGEVGRAASLELGCQFGRHPLVQKPDRWDSAHPRGCSVDPRPSITQRTMSSVPGPLGTTACRRRIGMPGRSLSNTLPPPPLDFGNAQRTTVVWMWDMEHSSQMKSGCPSVLNLTP